jgi:putative membrane protein
MRTLALAAACACIAAPVFAQTPTPPKKSPSSMPSTAGIASAPPTADFVNKVAISDMFEIQSSQLAQQKGAAADKKFGSKMVHDHSQTTKELKSLVNGGKVQAQLPTALDNEHQQMLDDLKSASGADFAQKYADAQKKGHEDAVAMFQAYAQSGDNPELKKWAAKTLPHLKQHLQMANALK